MTYFDSGYETDRCYASGRNVLTRLEMEPRELTVYCCDGGKLELLGDILSYSKNWPLFVNYKDDWYQFEANELMPEEAIGNYHGHSVYNLVDTDVVPEKYLQERYYL